MDGRAQPREVLGVQGAHAQAVERGDDQPQLGVADRQHPLRDVAQTVAPPAVPPGRARRATTCTVAATIASRTRLDASARTPVTNPETTGTFVLASGVQLY